MFVSEPSRRGDPLLGLYIGVPAAAAGEGAQLNQSPKPAIHLLAPLRGEQALRPDERRLRRRASGRRCSGGLPTTPRSCAGMHGPSFPMLRLVAISPSPSDASLRSARPRLL